MFIFSSFWCLIFISWVFFVIQLHQYLHLHLYHILFLNMNLLCRWDVPIDIQSCVASRCFALIRLQMSNVALCCMVLWCCFEISNNFLLQKRFHFLISWTILHLRSSMLLCKFAFSEKLNYLEYVEHLDNLMQKIQWLAHISRLPPRSISLSKTSTKA